MNNRGEFIFLKHKSIKQSTVIKFLKYLLVIVAGGLVTTFFIVMTFIVIFSVIISSASSEEFNVHHPNSIYHITLNKQIVERAPYNPLQDIKFLNQIEQPTLGLNDIIANIKKAADNPNIKGIFLEVDFVQGGIATVSDIRKALEEFKKTGKFIVAYGDFFDKKAYFLATIADELYLNPMGAVEFTGLKSEVHFFKGTFEKLGIQPYVFRAGNFKSFGERYVDSELSSENEEQLRSYLFGVWNNMLEEISESRNIPVSQLINIAENLGSVTPEKILSNRLVDKLLYKDQVIEVIKEKCGISSSEKIALISHKLMTKVPNTITSDDLNKIAVIYAWGDVIMGSGEEGNIGAERISKAIRKAREDHNIKAVVLRVNSGGGSALASEVIWRELELTKKVKPVVSSFGDIAASGGYYISVPADTIICSEYTLTGSIGVVGVLFNAQEFFNQKLGITHDLVKTNSHADFGSVFRKITPAEKASVQNMIDDIYGSFVNHVADGRKRSFEEINKVAQGRIWNATDAKKHKLVDGFGNLNDAIRIAAQMAGLTNYSIQELPARETPLEAIFNTSTEKVKNNQLRNELGDAYRYYNDIKSLLSTGKYQALIPYNIDIE